MRITLEGELRVEDGRVTIDGTFLDEEIITALGLGGEIDGKQIETPYRVRFEPIEP